MIPKFTHSSSYHESAKLQIAYLPALIGSMIFLVIFGGFIPGFNSWRETSAILKQKQEINSVLSSKALMLASFDLTELKSKLDLATKAIPIKPPYRQTLALMSALADRHKISVDGLELIKQGESIGIRITVAGTYPNIYSFLQNLENAVPLVSVDSINLNSRSSSDLAEKTYSADLNLSFYFQSSPKTFGKLTEKLPVISAAEEKNLREINGFEFFDMQSGGALSLDASNRAVKLFPD